jgi:hypothetical protein
LISASFFEKVIVIVLLFALKFPLWIGEWTIPERTVSDGKAVDPQEAASLIGNLREFSRMGFQEMWSKRENTLNDNGF